MFGCTATMSFTMIENKTGPKTVPCGTPLLMPTNVVENIIFPLPLPPSFSRLTSVQLSRGFFPLLPEKQTKHVPKMPPATQVTKPYESPSMPQRVRASLTARLLMLMFPTAIKIKLVYPRFK